MGSNRKQFTYENSSPSIIKVFNLFDPDYLFLHKGLSMYLSTTQDNKYTIFAVYITLDCFDNQKGYFSTSCYRIFPRARRYNLLKTLFIDLVYENYSELKSFIEKDENITNLFIPSKDEIKKDVEILIKSFL